MEVARALKGQRIADAAGVVMVLEVMLELLCKFELSSLSVFKFVSGAGG
jgi:hypothetical protein